MPAGLLHSVARLVAAPDPRADAQLVAAFLHDANQNAFAELVRRHGPTVLGVCRRLLGPTPDAEDAFQATFLVLVRRARSTEWRASLGPWLYGVALKVSRKARTARAKRLTNEQQVPAMNEPSREPPEPDDTGAVVDAELAALPAKYRQPLILCEIQGASRRDAARQLGLTEGTLSSRLARGRKMLRDRLAKRGVAPVAAGLAVAVPAALATATVRSAVGVLTHATGAVPVGVLFLTDGVTKTMIAKWKLVGVLAVTCLGLTGFGSWRGSAQPAPVTVTATNQPLAPPPAANGKEAEKPERCEAHQETVATIFGNVPITRDQFMDHLLRRYGKKELELFVNKQIVAHAFAQKGLKLTPAEVTAALEDQCKLLGRTRDQFVAEVLPKYNKTLEQWTEDVIEPRLMLEQLLKGKVPAVTEAELRQAFDARYGEKVQCRVITWSKDDGEAARKAYESVRDDKEAFDRQARRSSDPNLAATGGFVAPVPRSLPRDAAPLQRAAAKLGAGEVSPLIATEDGFAVVKCVAVVPADKSKSFDKEKPVLLGSVLEARIEREVPKLFNDLKREANPKYHLTFPEPKVVPNPVN